MKGDFDGRPNVVDRFFTKMSEPKNLARILRWAWITSLLVLVLGYILIFIKIRDILPI